jgi:hypothetical protein
LWGDSKKVIKEQPPDEVMCIVSLYLREGCPLLIVETDVNGDSKCTNEI